MEKYPYLDDESTVHDQLNFSLYTPALLDIIESGITPITIGIFGKWGSGKTSLMKMLNYGISGKPTYRSIWFTAWKYDQQESLWRALILRVIDGLFPVDGNGNRLVVDKIDEEDSLINGIKLLESLEKSIYQDVNWETQGKWSININKTAKGVATLPAWLLLHSFGLGDLSKELGISPEFSKMVERESKKHRINQLKSREQFEDTFKQAISCILGNKGKLIIFIDDLDRCLPEKAIEILEAIKLFLNVEGTIFVLGMDREIIQQGIDIYYRKMVNKNETGYLPFMDGDAYLQKIIQIPFTIPKMSAEICGHYIKQMLSQFPSGFTNDETYEITNNIFIQGLISNPRQIKRAINVFHLLRNIVFIYENNHLIPKGNIFWPLLAKTVIIQIQWSELYQEWCRYPLLIQVLEEKYRNLGKEEISFEQISMPRIGEIISPYINDWKKYSLLEKILCIPRNTDSDYHKATFINMSSKEIESYLYLASASEFQQMPIGNIHTIDWKEELRSGDEVKIRNVISNIRQNVPEQNSEIHKQIKNTMLTLMTSKELSLEKKCVIGEQLGNIGDNRFNKNKCNFPDDVNFGFIGIAKDNLYMNDEQGRVQNPHLSDYFMARFPVTVAQFKVYLQINGFSDQEFPLLHQDVGNRTMRYVNIANVISYIDWFNSYVQSMSDSMEINQLFRRGWRADLPSEMEWKISAYGIEEKRFPWGNNKRYDCANTYESNLNRPTPVGLFPEGKSIYSVEDLCGNVWEWTKTKGKRGGRIICGGSFRHELIEMGFSQEESPQNKRADVGFRLVLRQDD